MALSTPAPPVKTLLAGERDTLRAQIELPKFLFAPVTAGEEVGRVRYFAGERELCALPITTAETTAARPVAGYGERFARILGELLGEFLRL